MTAAITTTIRTRGAEATMTEKPKGGQVKFLLTRVALGASAVTVFLGLWGAVAATDESGEQATGWDPAVDPTALVQDGWQWNATRGEWVLIEAPADAAPASPPVVIVERQPIYYVTEYIRQAAEPPAPGVATASNSDSPAPSVEPTATSSEPAGGGAVAAKPVAPPLPVPAEPVNEPAAAPAPKPAPAPAAPAPPLAPAAPAPASPPPPAPTAPPKPASSGKTSKAS